MTILTRTDLLTAYADNSTGNITAQQHRNFVDSVMVYGDLHIENELGFVVTGTPAKIPFSTTNFSYGMEADVANDRFNNVVPGHYRVSLSLDILLAGNSVTYSIGMYAEDTIVGSTFDYNTRDDSLRLSRAFVIPANIAASAAYVDVRISATSAQTIDIYSCDWIIERMGSA